MRSADLSSANLSYANLSSADLRSADLSSANLSYADLSSADFNEGTSMFLIQCPEEGSFICWKKARGKIVKLQVCEDAKRSSATTLKCRCSSALVLEIQNLEGDKLEIDSVQSDYDSNFVYKVGSISIVQDFNEDRFNECSAGIHFFINRSMAVKYN